MPEPTLIRTCLESPGSCPPTPSSLVCLMARRHPEPPSAPIESYRLLRSGSTILTDAIEATSLMPLLSHTAHFNVKTCSCWCLIGAFGRLDELAGYESVPITLEEP